MSFEILQHLVGPSRCDLKSEFQGKCAPSLIYSPTTEVRIVPQNVMFIFG